MPPLPISFIAKGGNILSFSNSTRSGEERFYLARVEWELKRVSKLELNDFRRSLSPIAKNLR